MEPTHQHGHILDLDIFIYTDIRVSTVSDVALSDHYCVCLGVLLAVGRAITSRHVISHEIFTSSSESSSCDDLADYFNSLLLDGINNAAPLRSKKISSIRKGEILRS